MKKRDKKKGKKNKKGKKGKRNTHTHIESWTETVGQGQWDRDRERHWGRICKMQGQWYRQKDAHPGKGGPAPCPCLGPRGTLIRPWFQSED